MTKETEKAFKILFCEYKRRRKDGSSKQEALHFEDGSVEKIKAFSKWQAADISYAMQELKSANYIRIDILGDIDLCESGIEFMEEKPKEFFSELGGLFDLISLIT